MNKMIINLLLLLIAQLIRWEEVFNAWRQVVRREDSNDDTVDFGQESNRNDRSASDTFGNDVYGKKTKAPRKYTTIKSKTKAILLKYFVSPLSAIRDMPDFRDDDELCDPKSRDYVQAAFDDFGKDLNDRTLRELYELLSNGEPVFLTSMLYGTLEESIKVVDDLLRYQFDDCDERICIFLKSVVDVFDKNIAKLNTIVVHAPPSSGKNYFFDMVFAIALNYGQLGQANKHNLFAFQEAPNKRILLWNEPNYEPCLTDTLKMMFAGDPFVVRVKNQGDNHVKRTPVVVLTNNMVGFMMDPAFRDRIVKYTWKSAAFLGDINYKPYPMALFSILNKYNVTF